MSKQQASIQQQEQQILKELVLIKPVLPSTDKDKAIAFNLQNQLINKPVPEWKVDHEFKVMLAQDCSKRCIYPKNKQLDALTIEIRSQQKFNPANYQMSYGEQLCLNRCISKLMNVKEIVDNKMRGQVEENPILFNQNLP